MTAAPAGPATDVESRPFWEGLRARRLELQVCGACGRHRFPRMPSCPYCGTAGGTDVVVPGTGRVYSWVRVHRPLGPRSAGGELPYAVATVTLDTGPRLVGRLEPADRAAIDLPVRPRFVDHPGEPGQPGWTELRFEPDDGPPAPRPDGVPGADRAGPANAGSEGP